MLCTHQQQALQELHAVDLKHLPNVETLFFVPRRFAIQISCVGMTFLN